MVPNGGAEWPLSKKFGCSFKTAEKVILIAKELGLKPIGVSFHVGSQQLSLKTWKKAIAMHQMFLKIYIKKDYT